MKETFSKSIVTSSGEFSVKKPAKSDVILLSVKGIIRLLLFVVLILVIANLVSLYMVEVFSVKTHFALSLFANFDMNGEWNFPTIFSFGLLLLSALLLFIASLIRDEKSKGNHIYWKILSIIFFFLATDEIMGIHERFNFLKDKIHGDFLGLLHYPWILPYVLFAGVVGGFFLNFVFRLPKKTKNLIIISGISYCTAAIAFELPEGYLALSQGEYTFWWYLTCCIEETFEMCSIILFIYALMDYIRSHSAKITFIPKMDF